MKHSIIKTFSIILSTALIVSCGGGKEEEEFKFYALKEAASQQLELTVEASGTVEAISSIEIKSKASGQILFLGAEIGDYVDEGVVLARIDQRTPTNTLAQANADLEVAKVRLSNAKNQFERSKRLHDEGNISDKSFEDAQESFSSARAQLVRAEVFLENARIALDDTSVRSPIAGTVISRPAEVGQVITSPTSAVGGGTLLMEMADLNKVRVRALIDEIDIGKITIGQEVTLKVSAYRDRKFVGVVSKIEPMSKIDQNVTTFPVLIDIENQEVFDVLVNNEDLSHKMLDIASEVVGSENVALRPNVIAGSEDFADMLKVVPGAYCNVGHGGTVPLHNEGFVLDEDILPIGASIYAKIIESRTTV